jgi:hypothetical protein
MKVGPWPIFCSALCAFHSKDRILKIYPLFFESKVLIQSQKILAASCQQAYWNTDQFHSKCIWLFTQSVLPGEQHHPDHGIISQNTGLKNG